MKIALCCIGRLENRYSVEFVEHYLNLGFDKIFIYDNNYNGEEHFEDVLKNFVDKGCVEIINFRNKSESQFNAYNECYMNHKDEYEWMAFFDFDEFLVLENEKNIKDFLSKGCFDKYNCVLVNWKIMDDNGLVKNDGRPVMERFTREMDINKCISYSFPENNHVKSIVRCGGDITFKTNPHVPNGSIDCCDAMGNPCDLSPFKKFIFDGAYLKHFMTKTIQEWYEIKSKRGYPDGNTDFFKTHDIFDEFFKRNIKTDEKLEYIKSLGNYKKNNIDIFICTHKDFKPLVSNSVYKIVNCNGINNDTWNGLKGSFYSEIMSYFYIGKNYPLKKYVGFCHYRKYWSFMDNIPDLDTIFQTCGCVAAEQRESKVNMREEYKKFHNIEDLNIVENIIEDKFPSYNAAFKTFLYSKKMFPYNMFIMKREDFLEYCEFIEGVINEYLNIVGKDIVKRIEDNKDRYLKSFYPNSTVDYQYRIGGYLAERLTTVFIINKFKTVRVYPVKITETKYKKPTSEAKLDETTN